MDCRSYVHWVPRSTSLLFNISHLLWEQELDLCVKNPSVCNIFCWPVVSTWARAPYERSALTTLHQIAGPSFTAPVPIVQNQTPSFSSLRDSGPTLNSISLSSLSALSLGCLSLARLFILDSSRQKWSHGQKSLWMGWRDGLEFPSTHVWRLITAWIFRNMSVVSA